MGIAGKELKARLAKGADLKHEDVLVPEWNETVRVRALTAREMLTWSEATSTGRSGQALFELVAATVVDENGEPIFDAAAVERRPFALVNRLAEVAVRLSGDAKAQLENPSPAAPGVDSPSS